MAVFEAKSILEQELAVENLSQRQLEELFRQRGFSLSHSMISKMGYAVDILWPVMPKALSAGLGRPRPAPRLRRPAPPDPGVPRPQRVQPHRVPGGLPRHVRRPHRAAPVGFIRAREP